MKSKKIPPTKFRVTAEVKVWTEIEIHAESYEEALKKAYDLKAEDFASPIGELVDNEIIGIRGISCYDKDILLRR